MCLLTVCVCTVAGLLQGVEARVKRPEYARLLADCQAQYCGARLGLVEPVVRQRVAAFARQPLPTLTRSGCAHLMQVHLMHVRGLGLLTDAPTVRSAKATPDFTVRVWMAHLKA
jgi:hypothetical protein